MAAIKKRSLVDQVYEMLRGDIITLRRPLGSKLNVNELQDELGVSCTPIREAVNRLQQEGLVVYENNVGAHILDLDQHDITEIEQLAMTLHCAAIRLAMAHGDRAAIVTGLEKYLEEYRRARNVQSEVMAVNRFVGTFYAHCGNRRLDANMISIQGQQLLLRYIYADCLTERGSHVDRHARIGEGKIGFDALAALVNHPKLAGVPFYLEEPDSTLVIYERDVARFQEAYKG